MNLAEYKKKFGESDDAAPGWQAIDDALLNVYGQQEPKHWGSVIKFMMGGPDPLDGVSAYECRDGGRTHLHFCTYGFSSLYYDEESCGRESSGFGFELTFRLASPLPPLEESDWVLNLLNNLARYVFKSKRWFEPNQWIPAGGPIRADYPTNLVGLVFLQDPVLKEIETPHGRVEFVQIFGITSGELEAIKTKKITCEEFIEEQRRSNSLMVTDLDREKS